MLFLCSFEISSCKQADLIELMLSHCCDPRKCMSHCNIRIHRLHHVFRNSIPVSGSSKAVSAVCKDLMS